MTSSTTTCIVGDRQLPSGYETKTGIRFIWQNYYIGVACSITRTMSDTTMTDGDESSTDNMTDRSHMTETAVYSAAGVVLQLGLGDLGLGGLLPGLPL